MIADFRKIDEARKLLGLGEEASLLEVKEAYRELALRYHPDRSEPGNKKDREEMSKKINLAYETLMIYCANRKFLFKEKEVKGTLIEEEMRDRMRRFYESWRNDAEA